MHHHDQEIYLPTQFRNFGPGPGRFGWIYRMSHVGCPVNGTFDIFHGIDKKGLLWKTDIYAKVDYMDRKRDAERALWVGIRNDPKLEWLSQWVNSLPGRKELVVDQRWWITHEHVEKADETPGFSF